MKKFLVWLLPNIIKSLLRKILNNTKRVFYIREKLFLFIKMNGLVFTLKQLYFMYIYESHAVTFQNLTSLEPNKELYSVSIVIPTYNGLDDLSRLIPQLVSQKGFSSIEIVIVDSSSRDGTQAFIDNFEDVVFISIPQKDFSHSYARNLGFTHATNDTVLFMVQDAMPTSHSWLYSFLHVFKKSDAVALSCRQLPNVEADLYACYGLAQFHDFLDIKEAKTRVVKKYVDSIMLTRKLAQLDNVACLVKADIFKKYKFQGKFAEDLDLGLRLIKDDYKIGITSEVSVVHSHVRPVYYHMKRAMVETEVVEKMLGKHDTGADIKEQLSDILNTSFLVARLLEEVNNLPAVLDMDEFNARMIGMIEIFLTREYDKNEYNDMYRTLDKYDKNFVSFIELLFKNKIELKKGDLFYYMLNVHNEAASFMKSRYEIIDKKVALEYAMFILNSYATSVGIRFAQNKQEYLIKYSFLDDLFDELHKGV